MNLAEFVHREILWFESGHLFGEPLVFQVLSNIFPPSWFAQDRENSLHHDLSSKACIVLKTNLVKLVAVQFQNGSLSFLQTGRLLNFGERHDIRSQFWSCKCLINFIDFNYDVLCRSFIVAIFYSRERIIVRLGCVFIIHLFDLVD